MQYACTPVAEAAAWSRTSTSGEAAGVGHTARRACRAAQPAALWCCLAGRPGGAVKHILPLGSPGGPVLPHP